MKSDYITLLKNAHLSVTSVRVAVLDALHANPHIDAATLYNLVQRQIKSASRQGIYNNLNALVEHGIIREIKPKGQPSLYETRTGDNHHHIVCRSCGTVLDAVCQGHAVPCLLPQDNYGFRIDEAEVIFWGICPTCQKRKKGK